MEAGRDWFLWFWRWPAVSSVLYTALIVHVFLGLWALYRRRTLRMPAWEATQLVLGLTIPPILIAHVVGNRLAHARVGIVDAGELVGQPVANDVGEGNRRGRQARAEVRSCPPGASERASP